MSPDQDEDLGAESDESESVIMVAPKTRRKQIVRAGSSKIPPMKRVAPKEEEAAWTDALKTSKDGLLLIKDTATQLIDTFHRATEGYEWMVGVLSDAYTEAGMVKLEGLAEFLKHNLSNRKVQE